jgi:hypothetical protein
MILISHLINVSADHPLGEMSLKLDAPASLGLQNGYLDRKRDLLEKSSPTKNSELKILYFMFLSNI